MAQKDQLDTTMRELALISGFSEEFLHERLSSSMYPEEETDAYTIDEACEVCTRAEKDSREYLAAMYLWLHLSKVAVDKAKDFQQTRRAYLEAPLGSVVRQRGLEKMLDHAEKCGQIQWIACQTQESCYALFKEKIEEKQRKLCKE